MRWILGFLLLFLAACSMGTPPSSAGGLGFQLRPNPEVSTMWRIRFGHPVTSAVVQTVMASTAEITSTGLTLELDEWGGSKVATWTGRLGQGQPDRTRIWVDVQDGSNWDTLFSGALVERPSRGTGERQAVGDKYLRLKELPVDRETSEGDATTMMAEVVNLSAQPDLPHLAVAALTASGTTVKRTHNGENVAAALDGMVGILTGKGWTVRPDGSLYVGPPVALEAVVNRAAIGVLVQDRPVNSEGMVTAIQWVYRPVGSKKSVRYESRHPSAATSGRATRTLTVGVAEAKTVLRRAAGVYQTTEFLGGGTEHNYTLTPAEVDRWTDDSLETYDFLTDRTKLTLTEAADWVRIQVLAPGTGVLTLTVKDAGGAQVSQQQLSRATSPTWTVLFLYDLGVNWTVTLEQSDLAPTQPGALAEFNPQRFHRPLLDAAAESLFRPPPAHVASASVLGLQPPAGKARIVTPNEPDVTERVVGTRYLIREPFRTEYLIGEPDLSTDAQTLAVLIERLDDGAVSRAIDAGGTD